MPDITPRNVVFPDRWRKSDCQSEPLHVTKATTAQVIDALKLTKAGLNAGMSAREIREYEILQCEKRIEAEAKRHLAFSNIESTVIFLRALAADIEIGVEI